jgi:UDP-galactose transporter B1
MARAKSASRRVADAASETIAQNGGSAFEHKLEEVAEAAARDPQEQKQSGLFALAICVGGIYASL